MLVYQEEMEGLSVMAHQVMDETHISSQISTRATKITARYHMLLLHLLVTYHRLYIVYINVLLYIYIEQMCL